MAFGWFYGGRTVLRLKKIAAGGKNGGGTFRVDWFGHTKPQKNKDLE